MQNVDAINKSYENLDIINASEIGELIKQSLACKINLLIYGEPGCGKSSIIEQFAKDNGWNFVQLGCASLCEEMLNGIPQLDTATGIISYSMPDWLANVIEFAKRDPETPQILFLDELTLAAVEVAKGLQILLTQRSLATRPQDILPENVVIVSATNTAEDSCDGLELSRPLKTRFMSVRMQNKPQDFKQYVLAKIECGELLQDVKALIGEERTTQFVTDTINDFSEFWCDNTQFYGTNPRTIMNFYKACNYVAQTKQAFTASDAETIARRTVGHKTATTTWYHAQDLSRAQSAKPRENKELFPDANQIASMSVDELQWTREDIMRSPKASTQKALNAIILINARLLDIEKEKAAKN